MQHARQAPLPLAVQKALLEKRCKTKACSVGAMHGLHWEGFVQPSETMSEYLISVDLRLGGRFVPRPIVNVMQPALQTIDERRCEHLYPGGDLCLYYPRAGEWGPHMAISNSTVPWASRWLFFYELWLANGGVWLGGGIHPNLKRSKQEQSR